jgi:hypothetical protein
MLRDPQLVFENAEAAAAQFRDRMTTAEDGAFMDYDVAAAEQGGLYGAPPGAGAGWQQPQPDAAAGQQQYAFDVNPPQQ